MDNKKVKNSFYMKYNIIIVCAFFVVFVLSCGMIALQIRNNTKAELLQLQEHFQVRALALDNLIASVSSHVDILQNQADSFWLEKENNKSVLFKSLIQNSPEYYSLDMIPASYSKEGLANLTGSGTLAALSPQSREEHEMAFSLNPLFESTKQNIKNTAWVYYTSKNGFINIYPWVSSDSYKFSPELYTHEFFSWGKEEVNPERNIFWTRAYIDEAGLGMMVTAAKPVYRADEFLGTVAIDITLDQLREYVKDDDGLYGYIMIFNDQLQLLAHPELVSSGDKVIKTYAEGLPEKIKTGLLKDGVPPDLSPLELSSAGPYYYFYYQLENAPWQLLYFIEKSSIFKLSLSSIGILFFTLIAGLLLILYVTNRITFQDFIDPAAKLVNQIDLENRGTPAELPVLPAPWRPWSYSIQKTFGANRLLIEEIKEKNEALAERNISIERYMPKFILILSDNRDIGNTTICNYIAGTLSNFETADKKTVFMNFPDPEAIGEKINIEPGGHIFKHPNGYDIWTSYNLRTHHEELEELTGSLLISKVMNKYDNIVINAFMENETFDENLKTLAKYAKVVITIVPPEENRVKRIESIHKQVTQIVRQDRTNLYTIINRSLEKYRDTPFSGTADFEIPYSPAPYPFSKQKFEIPREIKPVIDTIVDRLERVHQISVFIPTTINVDRKIDTSEYVKRTLELLGKNFGGATSSKAKGVWNSEEAGLVDETIYIVVTYTTDSGLNEYVDDVIDYVREMKKELDQEAMAIEIDKKMILI